MAERAGVTLKGLACSFSLIDGFPLWMLHCLPLAMVLSENSTEYTFSPRACYPKRTDRGLPAFFGWNTNTNLPFFTSPLYIPGPRVEQCSLDAYSEISNWIRSGSLKRSKRGGVTLDMNRS